MELGPTRQKYGGMYQQTTCVLSVHLPHRLASTHPGFLWVENHSRNLLYALTTSLLTSGSQTQHGMASSWVTHGNGTGQDGHPSK